MNLKKQRGFWLYTGVCFLTMSVLQFDDSIFLGWLMLVVSILHFANAYRVHKQINK